LAAIARTEAGFCGYGNRSGNVLFDSGNRKEGMEHLQRAVSLDRTFLMAQSLRHGPGRVGTMTPQSSNYKRRSSFSGFGGVSL